MPTYDYICDNCDHKFEVYQSMKDEKLTTCPNCGKNTLRRLIGAGSGLIFKGSGFYLTDYKNKSTESLVKASSDSDGKKTETTSASGEAPKTDARTTSDNGSSSSGKKSSDSKSDKKPAEKTEKKAVKKSEDNNNSK